MRYCSLEEDLILPVLPYKGADGDYSSIPRPLTCVVPQGIFILSVMLFNNM